MSERLTDDALRDWRSERNSPADLGIADELLSLRPENERLLEALTPSMETKAAYIGEFHFDVSHVDEFGDEVSTRYDVPWTTIKEIMAAIVDRATLKAGETRAEPPKKMSYPYVACRGCGIIYPYGTAMCEKCSSQSGDFRAELKKAVENGL